MAAVLCQVCYRIYKRWRYRLFFFNNRDVNEFIFNQFIAQLLFITCLYRERNLINRIVIILNVKNNDSSDNFYKTIL